MTKPGLKSAGAIFLKGCLYIILYNIFDKKILKIEFNLFVHYLESNVIIHKIYMLYKLIKTEVNLIILID